MRSYVCEPRCNTAAVPCRGRRAYRPADRGEGLNLAMHDVRVLAEALIAFHREGSRELLDRYSTRCLRRIWRAEHFSWWKTTMLHKSPSSDELDERLQLSQLRYLATSTAAETSLAENYVGPESD